MADPFLVSYSCIWQEGSGLRSLRLPVLAVECPLLHLQAG